MYDAEYVASFYYILLYLTSFFSLASKITVKLIISVGCRNFVCLIVLFLILISFQKCTNWSEYIRYNINISICVYVVQNCEKYLIRL